METQAQPEIEQTIHTNSYGLGCAEFLLFNLQKVIKASLARDMKPI